MPEIWCSQPDPLTDRQAQPPPVALQALQISEVRLRSILLGTFPQGKEEKVLKGPLTRPYKLHCSSGTESLNPVEKREYRCNKWDSRPHHPASASRQSFCLHQEGKTCPFYTDWSFTGNSQEYHKKLYLIGKNLGQTKTCDNGTGKHSHHIH